MDYQEELITTYLNICKAYKERLGHQEAEEAAKESKTQKPPRTYDKALKLLAELEAMLP